MPLLACLDCVLPVDLGFELSCQQHGVAIVSLVVRDHCRGEALDDEVLDCGETDPSVWRFDLPSPRPAPIVSAAHELDEERPATPRPTHPGLLESPLP